MSTAQDIIVIDDSDEELQSLPMQSSSVSESQPTKRSRPLSSKAKKKKVTFNLNHIRVATNAKTQGKTPIIKKSLKMRDHVTTMLHINPRGSRIQKKEKRAIGSKSKPFRPTPITYAGSSSFQNTRYSSRLLPKHLQMLRDAHIRERERASAGLPPSRVRFPNLNDRESAHRQFYVHQMQAQKIDADVRDGYIERVDDRHVIQLDDLDPELLTGKPLTDVQQAWVKRKQARRAGPRSSLFPPNIRPHDQYTEYIRFTDKTRMRHPNAQACRECGSMLWGTRTLFPLSRPAESHPSPEVMNPGVPLCEGCSRLFTCVRDRSEKMDLIYWLVTGKTSCGIPPKPSNDALRHVCKLRVIAMQKRAHHHFMDLPANFVTAEQLFNSVKSRDMRCYMTGSPLTLTPGRFNSLTFDHSKPISLSMDQPYCWSIKNLVPMAHCMNLVKGNETDKELSRYFLNFVRHYNEDTI
ncbi:hypothetical protein BD408DRAFT_433170 [Parasitella parasitica]|nr:hypothetical protein BD408DRAFT_433170 [Parasitella parasitica]